MLFCHPNRLVFYHKLWRKNPLHTQDYRTHYLSTLMAYVMFELCVYVFETQELETLNVNAEFLISEKYIAKYEFGGSTDIELQFKKGSVVTVIEKAENGWWKGICEGQVGWFPESYVRPPPKTETKAESNHTPNVQEERQQVEQPRGMDEMMASGDCHVTSYFTHLIELLQ